MTSSLGKYNILLSAISALFHSFAVTAKKLRKKNNIIFCQCQKKIKTFTSNYYIDRIVKGNMLLAICFQGIYIPLISLATSFSVTSLWNTRNKKSNFTLYFSSGTARARGYIYIYIYIYILLIM
jgi:hypothetical protein